jgi:hypothetical protein
MTVIEDAVQASAVGLRPQIAFGRRFGELTYAQECELVAGKPFTSRHTVVVAD